MPKTEPFDHYPDEYDDWFAIKKAVPHGRKGIEIGVGSGIFAEPLGIDEGIDPSRAMRERAKERNIKAIDAVAEDLPYHDSSKNSPVGQIYLEHKTESVFYRDAVFYSTEKVYEVLNATGFVIENTWQTVFGEIENIKEVQEVLEGHGKGNFIVIIARKTVKN
jgi:ubiquinone/menaquinone biosynthesis C-methylase UbiE